jgi:hypothetical protein
MTVVDATKLPDAPNIVCLAGSVAGEFRYTGKDGNILQGVAALPGTPFATWPAGTYAFRGIAAYDVNSLQQRAVSVQAQIDVLSASNSPIIGIEWDTMSSSPTLTRIDALGHEIEAVDTAFFDRHPVFGGRWRCVRDRATGKITYGANARGDGLILDGSAGDVLVRKPAYYCKTRVRRRDRPRPVVGICPPRGWVLATPLLLHARRRGTRPVHVLRGLRVVRARLRRPVPARFGLRETARNRGRSIPGPAEQRPSQHRRR